jgi:hypothetical protein
MMGLYSVLNPRFDTMSVNHLWNSELLTLAAILLAIKSIGGCVAKRSFCIERVMFAAKLEVIPKVLFSTLSLIALFGFLDVEKIKAQLLRPNAGEPMPSFEVATIRLNSSALIQRLYGAAMTDSAWRIYR